MKDKAIPFYFNPGVPPTIRVKDSNGEEYELEAILGVERVTDLGTKDHISGNTKFQVDFAVDLKSKRVPKDLGVPELLVEAPLNYKS